MDVTVVSPLQAATVAEAAVTPGHALTFAYQRKLRGAAEDCRREGIAFLPLAVESLGGWHSAAEAKVKKLGAALARQSGQEEGEVLRHLWGRLGLLQSWATVCPRTLPLQWTDSTKLYHSKTIP